MCLLGNLFLNCTVVSDTIVTFECLPVEKELFVNLKISFNGVDYIDTGLVFSFFHSPVIQKLSPPFSHELGSPIYIYGKGFNPVSGLSCIFRFNIDQIPIVVFAKFISFTLIECYAPPVNILAVRKIILEVSLDGISSKVNPSLEFRYVPFIYIHSVNPEIVSASGGSMLSITGQGFQKNIETIYFCQFHKKNGLLFRIKASTFSENLLHCKVS